MIPFKKKMAVVISVCMFALNCAGCTGRDTLQKEYKNDSKYYMALCALRKNDTSTAERYLKTAAKKATPVVSRRAQETLATLGSVQERIDRHEKLYEMFPDEDSLERLCAELFSHKEFARIIALTENLDVTSCRNSTAYYRCYSLEKKKDSRFQKTFYKWCTERIFSSWHYKMYCELSDSSGTIEFRADVYNQNYAVLADRAKKILDDPANHIPQLMSDAGKALLYGSSNSLSSAFYLDSIKGSMSASSLFYADFYAGRLYDRADSYRTRALNRFRSAMENAPSENNYDNALWYYLNTSLKTSITAAIEAVEKFGGTWNDPYYFDDFFDTLSVRLLSQHLWDDFYKTALLIDEKASDETCAKFSYISARLAQTGFIKLDQSETERLFKRALSSGTEMYYKLLAAYRLNLTDEETQKTVGEFGAKTNAVFDSDVERLLSGYADFGLPELIYDEWLRFGNRIGTECAKKISLFLNSCAAETNEYYSQSLRIAAKKANYPEQPLDVELLKLVYPQNFRNSVQTWCETFRLPQYLLYALIRTESFFNPQIVSHAGAVGLTQLMESTAADVARKLKVAQFDLNDSDTNIRFGAYYLEEMRRRLDGSSILALFAYNGGISRVRSWVKSANLEFGVNELPKDLFLEALPFAETRGYGRKVLSAAAMYGTLYYSKPCALVITEILGE